MNNQIELGAYELQCLPIVYTGEHKNNFFTAAVAAKMVNPKVWKDVKLSEFTLRSEPKYRSKIDILNEKVLIYSLVSSDEMGSDNLEIAKLIIQYCGLTLLIPTIRSFSSSPMFKYNVIPITIALLLTMPSDEEKVSLVDINNLS